MNMAIEIWQAAFSAADPQHPARALVEAGVVPDPAPAAPTDVTSDIDTLLSWWKWAAIVAGVFGLIGCGIMMMIGRRNRSSMAAEGASGVPWVLFGLTLVVLSSGIVSVFT
jgi:hypothetical protein